MSPRDMRPNAANLLVAQWFHGALVPRKRRRDPNAPKNYSREEARRRRQMERSAKKEARS